MTAVSPPAEVALGLPVPPLVPHAISVSLPTWKDNVGYEEGEKRVMNAMVSGYPRFFVNLRIRKLVAICLQKFGLPEEDCMLVPTQQVANWCHSFLKERTEKLSLPPVQPRLIHFLICPEDREKTDLPGTSGNAVLSQSCVDLHIVLFPERVASVAKEFWQHTGMGISSRLADHCLSLLPSQQPEPAQSTPARIMGKVVNRHYSAKRGSTPSSPNNKLSFTNADDLANDQSVYLEERYGRNLPISLAASAKRALRRRISGVLGHEFDSGDCGDEPYAGKEGLQVGPSTRDVPEVSEDDVYLYPTGMSAIWNAHNIALGTRPLAKSVCFGFPYTDTLKILQKWGPGCHFFGHGLDSDIDALEALLVEETKKNPDKPPLLDLFTEFPSNPLLRSADLARLRALADKYNFLLIVDETIGNFINVGVLKYADIVVSSLSKVFSGDANVMGGSLVLNPTRKHYATLKAYLREQFEDFYFDQDAIFMERNSRNFEQRIKVIDANTEAVCDFLYSHSVASGIHPHPVVKDVFYPKYETPENYDKYRYKAGDSSGGSDGGYGGLFSVTFISKAASHAFFDNLQCYKGPSLGTNFTLACPFTILAHFAELDWAAGYGVEEGLVRVSVGMEDRQTLLESFRLALEAAEKATR